MMMRWSISTLRPIHKPWSKEVTMAKKTHLEDTQQGREEEGEKSKKMKLTTPQLTQPSDCIDTLRFMHWTGQDRTGKRSMWHDDWVIEARHHRGK